MSETLCDDDSVRAFRSAIAWAVDAGMTIVDLLSERQLEQLFRVFQGRQRWSFELYEPLRAFAHAYTRLCSGERLRPLTFGDALVALDELLAREGRPAWAANGEPGAAFATLRFGETSEGIGRAQAANRIGWAAHAHQNRALVEQAAKQLPGRSALVLGAGKAFDLPLRLLAERYERLVLVDIDGAALVTTARHFLGDPLPKCVELVPWDVTGVAHAWPNLVDSAIDAHASEAQIREELIALLSSYRISPPPPLVSGPPGSVDVAYSCMVLTQLATPLTEYVTRALEQRFGEKEGPFDPRLRRAFGAFIHRVQHSHVQALLTCAQSVVLSSDVTERFARLSRSGIEEAISGELALIGTERLDELFPVRQARILAGTEWSWQRVAPTLSRLGSILRVHGVVAQPRRSAAA